MLIQTQALDETATGHPLLTKLETHGALPDADRELLRRMLTDVRSFDRRRDIISEGTRPDFVHLMIEGWSCRYAIVKDGSRQITALLAPGDFCDAHITISEHMDHSIATLTKARVAFISKSLMMEVAERPTLTKALWWASLVDEGVLRAWIVNMGRRDAFDRIAHLVCELHARLENVGLVRDNEFKLPLTQEDLGDALGLTQIHVNRSLRLLREKGLMTFAHQTIVVTDIATLRKVAGFDPSYLHLMGPRDSREE